MKFAVALVLAIFSFASYASAVPVDDIEARWIFKDTILAMSEGVRRNISAAVSFAKGVATEFTKILGQKKEQAIAQLMEIKNQLVQELKQLAAESIDKAKEVVFQQLKADLAAQIEKFDILKGKVEILQ